MNYYERHLGDYARDTAHLSMLEHGAYGLLLDRYYATEAGIPADQAHRVARARSKEERQAVDAVLSEFFALNDGVWTKGRVEEEIQKKHTKVAAAQGNGKKGGRPKKADETQEKPSGFYLGSEDKTQEKAHQTPDTRHQEEKSNLSVAVALRPEDRPQLALVDESPRGPKTLPDCPHAAVLALWGEVLPAMPQHLPSMWKGTRAAHLRARWRETAIEKGWTDEGQGLMFLRKLFGYVEQSAFLTGKTVSRDRRPFQVELAWLVNPTNWAKTLEGKYHQEAA